MNNFKQIFNSIRTAKFIPTVIMKNTISLQCVIMDENVNTALYKQHVVILGGKIIMLAVEVK